MDHDSRPGVGWAWGLPLQAVHCHNWLHPVWTDEGMAWVVLFRLYLCAGDGSLNFVTILYLWETITFPAAGMYTPIPMQVLHSCRHIK